MEFSELTRWIITLLPIIILLIVGKWIIRMFGQMDFDYVAGSSISFDSLGDLDTTLVDEVKVKCDGCGATNENESAFCEFCDSIMYEKEDDVTKSPNEVNGNCDGCGASNEQEDSYCGHCGSAMYTNGTIKITPIRVKAREVED